MNGPESLRSNQPGKPSFNKVMTPLKKNMMEARRGNVGEGANLPLTISKRGLIEFRCNFCNKSYSITVNGLLSYLIWLHLKISR